ncbi:TolC family protein [Asticcacaulis solisilvae]|uniref:TolC family protein n=1 Tax=Asticcacaulis solisilvae TaxID=1217274 RepID=UPI003FD8B8F7
MLGLSACVSYSAAPLTPQTLAAPAVTGPLPADAGALVRIAIDHDPAVAAARASLDAAVSAQKAAKNLPPLSLTLTAEYSKDADARRPWLWGGAVGIPLDIGAKREARVTAADLAVIKARYALADAVWSSRQRLRQALSDRYFARALVAIDRTLVGQREAFAAALARRVASGEDPRGLGAQAELDASAARQTLRQAEAKAIQAEADLARALDAAPETVAGLPDIAPPPPLDNETAGALIAKTLVSRADIASAVADYDAAENDLRAAIAAQYPDITIAPGYTWERGAVKWPVNLTLNLPPLDGNRANIAQAQKARLAAGKMLEDRVKSALHDADAAAASYRADLETEAAIRTKDLSLAEALSAQTERALKAGESDRTEALAAAAALTQTRASALQAAQTASDDRLKLEDAARQPADASELSLLSQEMTK